MKKPEEVSTPYCAQSALQTRDFAEALGVSAGSNKDSAVEVSLNAVYNSIINDTGSFPATNS
jgi:hypothetical protein